MGVIDALEVIDIDHQNSSLSAKTQAAIELGVQQLQCGSPAPETCQVIMSCLEPQCLAGLDQFVLQAENSCTHPQPGSQFRNVEWFGQVVIGPCLQAGYDILLLVSAGDQHDVPIPVFLCRANSAAKFYTVDAGHDPIKNEKVRWGRLLKQLPRLRSVFRRDHSIVPTMQSGLQKPAENGVVLRNEDGRGSISLQTRIRDESPVLLSVANGISPGRRLRSDASGYWFPYRKGS